MENKRLSDPMDEITRRLSQLTGIRKKTDDVYWDISKLEIEGSVYVDEMTTSPCIPDYVWRGFFLSTGGAAKKFKEGPMAKSGLVVLGNSILDYNGPKDVDGFFDVPCGYAHGRAR
jgi:hypothetical protein